MRKPVAGLPESLTLDLAKTADAKRLSKQLEGVPIDVLFCNAGVNLLGAAAVVEALVDHVAASERKTVCLISSAAPLAPEVSVRGLRKVIDGLRPADSGRFFAYDGAAIPW